MDFFTFHKSSQSIGLDRKRRYPVITYQRISKSHQLAGIRRVGQTLRITCHGGIENHFTCHRLFVAKRLAMKTAPVVED